MGSAAPRARPLGFRMTVVRAPVMMFHATGLRCHALGHHAAATRADTAAHRGLHPANAIDPVVSHGACAQAAVRAAIPVPAGERRGPLLRAAGGQP